MTNTSPKETNNVSKSGLDDFGEKDICKGGGGGGGGKKIFGTPPKDPF